MKTALKLLSLSSALFLGFINNQSQSYEYKKINLQSNVLISEASDQKGIKTVTAKGFGLSIDEAAKDAANNALKQVVGVFIDSETLLQDQTIINDGILQESKTIKENIREYSQGSIKYFEILSRNKIGSLYQVNARVDVRVKEFNTHLQKFAYKKSSFPGTNIATVINANKDNAEQSTRFFADKVIKPLIERSVYEIKVGEPKLLKNNLIQVPFTLSLSKEFMENLTSNLDNITTKSFVSYQKKDIPFTLPVLLFKKINNNWYEKQYFIKTTSQYINNMAYTSCKDETETFEKNLNYTELKNKKMDDIYFGRDSMCGYNPYLFIKHLKGRIFREYTPKGQISDVQALLNSKLTLPLQISLIDEKKETISKLVCGLMRCYSDRKLKLYGAKPPIYIRYSEIRNYDDKFVGTGKMRVYKSVSKYNSANTWRKQTLSLIDIKKNYFSIQNEKNYLLILNLEPEEISKIKDIEIKFEN